MPPVRHLALRISPRSRRLRAHRTLAMTNTTPRRSLRKYACYEPRWSYSGIVPPRVVTASSILTTSAFSKKSASTTITTP